MSLVEDAVEKLEALVFGSGCDDNLAVLRRRPDAPTCQYVKGVALECIFGGRITHLVTDYPVQVTTRISFMFGQPMNTPEKRTAACAILNAVGKFLCITRRTEACQKTDYVPCLSSLRAMLGENPVFVAGFIPGAADHLGGLLVDDPEKADIIMVSGDGILSDEGNAVLEQYRGKKRMVFLGPETSGVCSLLNLEHWCPFGK